MSRPLLSPSVLFGNLDHTVVVVDVPRSIEEAQELQEPLEPQEPETALNGGLSAPKKCRRLVSVPAPTKPFPTPRGPIGAEHNVGHSLAAQLAELATKAAVVGALCELEETGFDGPWCLPRCLPKDKDQKDETTPHGDAKDDTFIPTGARFLDGTIAECRDEFVAEAPQFDLIVLDPPWPNRSARRRRQGRKRKSGALEEEDSAAGDSTTSGKDQGYETALGMDAIRDMLEQIPVGAKLADDGIVAMWVTNKAACESLSTDPKRGVFRAWGVELVATWTWLKVTAHGEPIVSVDSHWRRPWERLLLARRPGASSVALPAHRVIVAVPDVHSRKPHLRPLLAPFLTPTKPRSSALRNVCGLEVFARNLTSGWWAWGNEVLLFQHSSWWSVDGEDEEETENIPGDGSVQPPKKE